jgi:hypothetical protein
MGRILIEWQVIFVAGTLQEKPEAISCLCALGAGGGRSQKRR